MNKVTEGELLEIGHSAPAPTAGAAPADKPARAFERLHALVRKGYVAELGDGTRSDAIVLRHLGRAPDLVLYPDGTVAPLGGRIPRFKRKVAIPSAIPAESDADQLSFMRFVDGVRHPRLIDRTRPFRVKYLYVPLGLAVFWGLCLAFTALLLDG